jgi:hypothetical protein
MTTSIMFVAFLIPERQYADLHMSCCA